MKVAVKSYSASLCITVNPFSIVCSCRWNRNVKFWISQRRSSASNKPEQMEIIFFRSDIGLELQCYNKICDEIVWLWCDNDIRPNTRVASAAFGFASFHSKSWVPAADCTGINLIKYAQFQWQCHLSAGVHRKWKLHKLFPFLAADHQTSCSCDVCLNQARPGIKLWPHTIYVPPTFHCVQYIPGGTCLPLISFDFARLKWCWNFSVLPLIPAIASCGVGWKVIHQCILHCKPEMCT